MKIIGIGLNKTGTSTLGVCMRHLGFKHISYNKEAFELWCKERYDELLQWIDQYDSFEDWPWPLIYKEIDKKHPGTRFILTRRKDAETWFNSLVKHADRIGPTDFRKYIYGYAMPHQHKEAHIRFYENHLHSVREYFKDRPDDLLEVCWEEGDGWGELANFLDLEKPDIPFPHVNKKPKILGKAKRLLKRFARGIIRRTA